ncbi:hypothetical protein P5704_024330 (plasmid) [Pseudomonas sp. FeN3W]|nr:hypothetical protein P5704_024330 [Pseudomonas sp. FeN3W]
MKFLMCWEFGMDLGHITFIRTVASGLIARGHTVIAAVKDTVHAYTQLNDLRVTWLQAPYCHSIKLNNHTVNHADILAGRGYDDPVALAGLTRAWESIFKMVNPDRVICESSPTAALVARSLQLPVIALDKGFFMPPVADPLPSFREFGHTPRSALRKKERAVLETINKAQAMNGFPRLDKFSDLFNYPCLWLTWPEISHFGKHNERHHLGPIYRGTGKGEILKWKTETAPHVFAYLKPGHRYSVSLLSDLLQQECEIIAYLPEWEKSQLERLPNQHLLTVSDKPINFDGLMEGADFMASHTGIGTVHSFLLNGKPQLMIPQQMEQYLLSKAIERSGLGLIVGSHEGLLNQVNIQNVLGLKDNAKSFAAGRRSPVENFDILMDNLTVS